MSEFDTFRPHPKPGKKAKKKRKPIRSKSRKMTIDELLHSLKVKSLGCIVYHKAKMNDDPCCGLIEYNHITDCGRRVKDENGDTHYNGIPLCRGHHRTGPISIGKSRKTFEKLYGTEEELLEIVKGKLK